MPSKVVACGLQDESHTFPAMAAVTSKEDINASGRLLSPMGGGQHRIECGKFEMSKRPQSGPFIYSKCKGMVSLKFLGVSRSRPYQRGTTVVHITNIVHTVWPGRILRKSSIQNSHTGPVIDSGNMTKDFRPPPRFYGPERVRCPRQMS